MVLEVKVMIVFILYSVKKANNEQFSILVNRKREEGEEVVHRIIESFDCFNFILLIRCFYSLYSLYSF